MQRQNRILRKTKAVFQPGRTTGETEADYRRKILIKDMKLNPELYRNQQVVNDYVESATMLHEDLEKEWQDPS